MRLGDLCSDIDCQWPKLQDRTDILKCGARRLDERMDMVTCACCGEFDYAHADDKDDMFPLVDIGELQAYRATPEFCARLRDPDRRREMEAVATWMEGVDGGVQARK